MGARRKAREYALQALYLVDLTPLTIDSAIQGVMKADEIEKKTKEFATTLATEAHAHREEIDATIVKYTRNWEMNRMAVLDRNLLRLGAYELLHELETPVSVIINEAVEIAKIFSTEDSGKFVNGILDQIKRERKT